MAKKEIITPAGMSQPTVPFNHGIKFGDLVFVAGQTAIDRSIMEARGDIREQTRFTMECIKQVLETAGTSMDNALSATCFLPNKEDFPAFNEEYAKFFHPNSRPTRATVEAGLMAPKGLVEVMLTAKGAGGPEKETITPSGVPAPTSPFSLATRFGDLIFVSGRSAFVASDGEAKGDIREQTRTTMDKIKVILEAAGASMDVILIANCYLPDGDDRAGFNEEYAKYFSPDRPARVVVGPPLMARNARVEVSVTAKVGNTAAKGIVSPIGMLPPKPPISQAVTFGNLVHVSGRSAVDTNTGTATGDVREQTRLTLDRIKLILETAGTSMSNVLTATCYLKNKSDFTGFNEEYAKYFGPDWPARATLETALHAPGEVLQMSVTAGMPE